MKQTIGIQAAITHKILGLAIMLLISSCHTTNNGLEDPINVAPKEIVVFCGNPGTGKSALCNSIFPKAVFQAGAHIGPGLTTEKQEYIYQGKKYIDTPGLSDVKLRKHAAKEIEAALKENNNYKIVFVVTFESGRVRPDDLETINTVCDAIDTPFEYGIIFNKMTKQVLNKVNQNREALVQGYLPTLHKAPALYLIVDRNEDMEDADNVYLPADSHSRIALLDFITQLKASKISAKQVKEVNVESYTEKVEKLQEELQQRLRYLQVALEKAQDEAKTARENANKAQRLSVGQPESFKPNIQFEVQVNCLVM